MAQITWNQLATPDMKAANALLLAGQAQNDAAITQAGKVVTDYQAANTKNNTDAIMNALQSAKSPEEYQAALANAQAIAATKSGDFDQEKFNAARLTQPGVLDAQQQQQRGWEDRAKLAEASRIMMAGGDPKELAALGVQSDAGLAALGTTYQQAFTNKETLRGSKLAEEKQASDTVNAEAALKVANAKQYEIDKKERLSTEGKTTVWKNGQPVVMNSTDYDSYMSGGTSSKGGFTPNRSGSPLEQLTESVAFVESRGSETDSKGNYITNTESGAKGKMQVVDSTNRDPGFGVVPAKDNSPEERTRVGRDYLSAMVNRYPNDTASALGAYNWGVGNMDSYLKTGKGVNGQPMPKETKDYIRKITGYMSDTAPSPSDAASSIATGNKSTVGKYDRDLNTYVASSVPTDKLQTTQGDLKVALNNINLEAGLKEEKGDTATNDANEAKWIAKNKSGIIGSILNLNSGSKRQVSIANQIDGFSGLPAKTRLGILEKVAAENTSETWKYWSSLGEDVLKAKFASAVKKEMDAQIPGRTEKRKAAVENALINFISHNAWKNGEPPVNVALAAVLGSPEKADAYLAMYPETDPNYRPSAPTPAQAASTIAAGTTVDKPPVNAPKSVVPVVTRTPENTPLGVRAIQGIGGVLGNIRDATSPSNIAASLFRGGSNATREAANKLKYGSMYPYMKANNDPRLNN